MFPARWPRSLLRLGTLATPLGDKVFLTTPSSARFLQFLRRNWLFPISSAVNCPNFAATVTALSPPPVADVLFLLDYFYLVVLFSVY